MKNKFAFLFYTPLGELVELTPQDMDWMENPPYSLNDFKEELNSLTASNFFIFLLDIASVGVLESSMLIYSLGVFYKASDYIYTSKYLYNTSLSHAIIVKKEIVANSGFTN